MMLMKDSVEVLPTSSPSMTFHMLLTLQPGLCSPHISSALLFQVLMNRKSHISDLRISLRLKPLIWTFLLEKSTHRSATPLSRKRMLELTKSLVTLSSRNRNSSCLQVRTFISNLLCSLPSVRFLEASFNLARILKQLLSPNVASSLRRVRKLEIQLRSLHLEPWTHSEIQWGP